MYITKISLSYFFLIMGIVSIIFYGYFKFITIKTSSKNSERDKIVGNMKDFESWQDRNIKMSYLSLFWAFVSIGTFVFLKFFYKAGLISIVLPFIYLAVIIISIVIFLPKKKVAR